MKRIQSYGNLQKESKNALSPKKKRNILDEKG